ncbi:MAG TPA: methylenetetrahydrofolate--tRNA-(uracil(54)-C(5))-methyltransferase (FADH(2)-oxidizing) TrmFO [Clostridiales bacterium]|nr:MAG: Methylenetetrahydrofolate--tRNA-(uracil-5-)-methyltransferase TrmFO [Firmicutes bacterium ADurb.Bin262]HOU09363.1 methylenetetrahydrofolate--tRNA-(uracil(54)-C(5))-methyltransferase (FADH(2)-oxidizing) TrmFO [Clostridiales bacterium]HQH62779.1 methylenetetrahydrofolate--tRNA-(uracil(54)-C(5))-methyltransferase (FADH(2)-oxidizing) TrmFO [Clostridiales bacterium]HQK72341.1 methylenetetrahydrofolate--tRNA-(uracil(54)-C(5))-methyltransferase (FADH(2)-oxidizing) TrmFO [Clostridiales bacterium
MNRATVIGGGFAGVEAAWRLAREGVRTTLIEMKPLKYSPAHTMPGLAEPVCSNSLKSQRTASASGLLKAEMRLAGSLCLACADLARIPAGGALAVDRALFSRLVTERIENEPLIELVRMEALEVPKKGVCVVAAGPLASDALALSIRALCGGALSFYDAAAPIVTAESIDMSRAFPQSRYGRGEESDYINCPLNREEYERFHAALAVAEVAPLRDFDRRPSYYEGCMPVEVLAKRGSDTLRFGPMKPIGLRDPATGHRPWAVLQLRKENLEGSLYNMVGFQTNLVFSEQKRVFFMIPALSNAEFARLGVMHRNTFIDSPRLLDSGLSFRAREGLFFAGQITGVEGYMESAASGIVAGINAARLLRGETPLVFPPETMTGALCAYISDPSVKDFQPMGANFGILPPPDLPVKDKQSRYEAYARRGIEKMREVLQLANHC